MSNVIGEPLEPYVANQINARQVLHGSGVNTTIRSDMQLNLLNSNTSWVKLGSGVSVSKERLKDIGFSPTQQESYDGMDLAKNNILFGGTSTLGINKVETNNGVKKYDSLKQRDGFLPRDPNSSYTYDSQFGFSPMAGIESVDIKTLNRGSLKKATVKLKANDRSQFDIIDLLYLRLGYTVLLEWGNAFFTPNGTNKVIIRNTLMEEMFFDKVSNGSYLDLLDPIENKRREYAGNYDGLFGKISNFSWSFNPDGTYDIELIIISLGDVIESLKTNLSVDKGTFEFIRAAGTPTQEGTESDPETEPPSESEITENNKDTDIISAMLFAWKFVNPKLESPQPYNNVSITTSEPKTYDVGHILQTSQGGSELDTLTSTSYVIEFKVPYYYKSEEDKANEREAERIQELVNRERITP